MNQNQNQNQASRFAEVGGGARGTSWDPRATEKNGMNYDPNSPFNMLEGYLHSMREIPSRTVNRDGSPQMLCIWKIQVVNPDKSLGEIFDIIGDTVLNDRLSQVVLQSYVGIQYQGRALKKGYQQGQPWSQTNSYHVWFVGVDHNVMPMQEVARQFGIKTTSPAQQQPAQYQQQPLQSLQQQYQQPTQLLHPAQNYNAQSFQQQPQGPTTQQFNTGAAHAAQQGNQQQPAQGFTPPAGFNPNVQNQQQPARQQPPQQPFNPSTVQNQGPPPPQNRPAARQQPLQPQQPAQNQGQQQGWDMGQDNEDLPF